uniref:G-protein coupled receptors family 1 profile domain-containing protein n=2 Tax=Acrobeloides nanus TaxID=290746 RepID=A0A914CUE8_9BILA
MEEPPEPLASDYVELTTLIVCFVVGAPLNLAAYTQLTERPISTRLDILKRHLNYSDLLVLFIYVPSRACWLLSYDWRGGDFLCKVVKFLHTFAFQISSNVIVCIALDRLLSVISSSHHSPDKANRRTRFMLWCAWLAAFIISAPQFAIWRSYLVFEEIGWHQCMQVWEILRAEAYISNNTEINAHVLLFEENIYLVMHMLCIFWIPATIVLLCYLIVSCWVYLNSKPSSFVFDGRAALARSRVSYQTGIETVDTMLTRATGINPKIMINDESIRPLTDYRPSIASSEIFKNNPYTPTISNSQTYTARLNRTRAIRVSFLLVAAYIICWLPYNALSLIQFIDSEIFNNHANK